MLNGTFYLYSSLACRFAQAKKSDKGIWYLTFDGDGNTAPVNSCAFDVVTAGNYITLYSKVASGYVVAASDDPNHALLVEGVSPGDEWAQFSVAGGKYIENTITLTSRPVGMIVEYTGKGWRLRADFRDEDSGATCSWSRSRR